MATGCWMRSISDTFKFIASLEKTELGLSTLYTNLLMEFINVAKKYLNNSVRNSFSRVNISRITLNNFEFVTFLYFFGRVNYVYIEDMNITDEHSNQFFNFFIDFSWSCSD